MLAVRGVQALAPLTRAPLSSAQLEQMSNIRARKTHGPKPPCPCPLHYPGIWAHSPKPPFNAQHPHFLPQHPPFWQLPESPHLAQVSTSSCPPLPCGSQGLSWQGQLQPQQLGLGRGAVGTVDAGPPCTHRDTPSPLQLLPGGGKNGPCHSELGFLGAWLTPHFPLPLHSTPLPGRKPVYEWRSLHPATLPGGCLPVSAWL